MTIPTHITLVATVEAAPASNLAGPQSLQRPFIRKQGVDKSTNEAENLTVFDLGSTATVQKDSSAYGWLGAMGAQLTQPSSKTCLGHANKKVEQRSAVLQQGKLIAAGFYQPALIPKI